jgi:iron complex outermembrane receptor protein
MSELVNLAGCSKEYRWKLLSTVSIVSLLVSMPQSSGALAADAESDHPTIWIELGGQLEHINTLGDAFAPSFLAANPNSEALKSGSPFEAQSLPHLSYGGEGKVTFEPDGTDWIFSASMRYGRASSDRHIHVQTKGVDFAKTSPLYQLQSIYYGHHSADTKEFADTVAKRSETHSILDFQAGRDVGLGIFGGHSTSNLSFGVRIAQFASKSDVTMKGRPDLHLYSVGWKYWHTYVAHEHAARSFRGIGPSVSWSGSVPLFENDGDSEISFDWGANAALLFGRQKAAVQHNTTGRVFHEKYAYASQYITRYQRGASPNRSRSVTVPNIGGFAGMSFRYSAARVNLGYRADFFIDAMDGGGDSRKTETVGFFGPVATISIGLGG